MLQSLLAERFKLAVHRETKEQRVYFLLVGKNGPKLKEAQKPDAENPDVQQVRGGRLPVSIFRDRIVGHAMRMQQFAAVLARPAAYQVVDRTGLRNGPWECRDGSSYIGNQFFFPDDDDKSLSSYCPDCPNPRWYPTCFRAYARSPRLPLLKFFVVVLDEESVSYI
jgi:Protein of unknown function (DUF3738)